MGGGTGDKALGTRRTNFKFSTHYFPRGLAPREVRKLFAYVDGGLGTSTELEETRSDVFGRWMQGFIFKKYRDGLACALMEFGIGQGGDFLSFGGTRTYIAVTLRAETPYKKRRRLTERLDSDIGEVLENYFKTH